MKKIQKVLMTILLIFAFCTPAIAAKPSLSSKKVAVTIGDTITISLNNAGSDNIKWSSSNKKVAAVKGIGNQAIIIGKKKGTATITAKCGKLKAKCKVTVKKGKTSKSVSLPDEVYNAVKGRWYKEASYIGCDIKFTRTKLTRYERGSHKVLKEYNLISVEKLQNGFWGLYKNQYKLTFKINNSYGGSFFYISKEDRSLGEGFDYFEDYFGDGKISYSGGSSLIVK